MPSHRLPPHGLRHNTTRCSEFLVTGDAGRVRPTGLTGGSPRCIVTVRGCGALSERARIERLVEELAEPLAAESGYALVEISYVREAGRRILRVVLDKPGGVTLDDCERFSHLLGDRLDALDPIPESYALEVASPGLDRVLKRDRDFLLFRGRRVEVRTYAPPEGAPPGRNVLRGELLGLEDGKVALRDDAGTVWRIARDQVALARLDPGF